MSATPVQEEAPIPMLPSSSSSQRTATLVDSEGSSAKQPWEQNTLKPTSPKPAHVIINVNPDPAQPDRPGPPRSAYVHPVNLYHTYRAPSPWQPRMPPSPSIDPSSAESSVHEPRRNWCSSAVWLSFLSCGTANKSYMKGVACVVFAITLILIVVLVFSLVTKKH